MPAKRWKTFAEWPDVRGAYRGDGHDRTPAEDRQPRCTGVHTADRRMPPVLHVHAAFGHQCNVTSTRQVVKCCRQPRRPAAWTGGHCAGKAEQRTGHRAVEVASVHRDLRAATMATEELDADWQIEDTPMVGNEDRIRRKAVGRDIPVDGREGPPQSCERERHHGEAARGSPTASVCMAHGAAATCLLSASHLGTMSDAVT